VPRPDAYVLECAFASNPDDLTASQVWTDITPYLDVKAGVRVTRGRTDEFSEMQPSTFACTLRNDGRFTAQRPASPYYPNVKSGKRIRFGVLRKGNGKQLDTDPSFNGTAPFSGSNKLYPWESVGTATVTIQSSTSFAQSGTTSMRILLSAGVAGTNKIRKKIYGFIPGKQYTASLYLRVGTGDPAMRFGVTGFGTSDTTTLNAFERESVTFTATAPVHELYVQNNATAAGTEDIFVDAVQVEEGAVATTFDSTAGVFSWRFTGEVNEWPTGWEGGPGLHAETLLTATDKFKRLGDRGELLTTLDEDIIDDVPFAYYPLNEPAGVDGTTQSAGDLSGNDEIPLTVRQSGGGGVITFGSEPGIPPFYVQKRTTVAFNPASNGNGPWLRGQLRKVPAIFSARGATVNVFAQESTSPITQGALAFLTATNGSYFGIRKRSNGNISAAYFDVDSGSTFEVDTGIGMTSLNPTMYTATLDVPSAGNGRITFYANGNAFGTPVTFPLAAIPTWAVVSVGGRASELFRGYISHVGFYNWPVSTGGIIGWWFSAFRGTDGAGSTSYARLNKLCIYTNLESPLRFVSGDGSFNPVPVGPQEIEGQPIEAMRLVETTEDGQFYIDGAGRSILRLRNARYNLAPSLAIDSERLDPDSVKFRGDDFGLMNDVTAERSDGASARVVNQDSVDDHGRVKAQLNAIPTTDDALRDLAAWRVNVFGIQRNRITGVKFSLLNDASVISTALLLDIGSKISIVNLPTQAPVSSLGLFIEGWGETISEEEWSMELNTSPADPYDVWQIGVAGHSEIGLTTRIAH